MQVTIFSVLMAVIWSSLLIVVFYLLRKKGLLMQTCSITGIIILYAFCVIRMLVPIEISEWTKVVPFTAVYNPMYRVARHEIIPGTGISVMAFLKYVWIVGAAVFLVRYALRYIKAYKYFMQLPDADDEKTLAICRDIVADDENTLSISRHKAKDGKEPRVKVSPGISVPCGFGIIQKMIILPDKEYTQEQLYFIISHEMAHIKNRDTLTKLLINVFCALIWWNPLVYLLKRDMNQSLEIRCDEVVVEGMDNESRSSYLSTILKEFKSLPDKSRINNGFHANLFEEHSESLIERFEIVSEPKIRKSGFPIASLLIAGCLLVTSYSFIFQPEYKSAERECLESEDGISVEKLSVICNADGTYLVESDNGTYIPVEPDVAEQLIELGAKVIYEEK